MTTTAPSDAWRLAADYADDYPAEAAEVLNGLGPDDVAAFLQSVVAATAGPLLNHLLPHLAAHCLARMPPGDAAKAAAAAAPWAAAAALRRLDGADRQAVLDALPTHAARRLRRLIGFDGHTAGAWADPRALALPGTTTAEQALSQVRDQPDLLAGELCVVGAEQRLGGVVATPDLVRAEPDTSLDSLARRDLAAIPASSPVSAAHDHPGWARLRSLPVTDVQDRLVGLLPYDRVLKAVGGDAGRGGGSVTEVAASVGQAYWLALTGLTTTLVALLTPDTPRRAHRRGQ